MKDNKFKIRANNSKEISEIQRILFKLGYVWADGQKRVLYKDRKKIFIFFEFIEKGILTFENIIMTNYFKEHGDKEVTLTKLKNKEFQIYLKKLMILHNLE